MPELVLKAERRQHLGTAACKKLRSGKRIPCVLYGHGGENVPLSVEHDNLVNVLEHHVRTFDVDLDGRIEHALVKDVAYNTFGTDVLHVDLIRIARDEKIQVEVPIRLFGHAQGVADGGILESPLAELLVECSADAIPGEIRVDISNLGIDSLLRVSDVTAPEGVKILSDAEIVVAAVREAKAALAPEAPPPEAAAAEPELIREPKKEAESEEKGKG